MYNINKEGDELARQVKCKICGEKIDKDKAYCIEKVNENNGKVTREYYHSKEEYEEDKFQKSLWKKLLVSIDEILGYTSVSKTKVNMLKELENAGYTRKQVYNCIENNKEEIKRYLNEKDIYDEYGKLSYIFACIKNKIKDDVDRSSFEVSYNLDIEDMVFETDEEIIKRIDEEKSRPTKGTIYDILNKINKDK